MALFYFLNILLVAGAFGILLYFYSRELVRRRRRDLTTSVLLLVRIPRAEGGADNPKLERKKFEDFLKRLIPRPRPDAETVPFLRRSLVLVCALPSLSLLM